MSSDNKRIAKNSFFLAIRTILTMVITLYSSRVVLKNLGVEDFGIFNVVASVILFWAALRGVFASSTQRFLNVAMAEKERGSSKRVFQTSLYVNAILAIIFTLLIGVIGLYFINKVLEIPSNRLVAANWVFLFSLASSLLGLITIPFDASVIANERMGFFALTTILDAAGKLLIAFLIPVFPIDGLFLYGLGVLILGIIIRLMVVIFTTSRFEEVSFRPKIYKDIYKSLLSFSGWNFLGNVSFHVVNEGLNFLLNIFFGPTLNAARGVAYQVRSAVGNFSNTILIASQPQTCKLMAKGEDQKVIKLFSLTTRSIYYLCLLMTVPIIFSAKEILTLWLGVVPDYTIEFVQIILAYTLIRTLHGPLNSLFFAAGDIKLYQIIEIIILPLTLLLSYIFLRLGFDPQIIFILMAIVEILNLMAICLWAKVKINFSITDYFKRDLLPITFVTIFSILTSYLIIHTLRVEYWITKSLISIFTTLLPLPLIGYKPSEFLAIIKSTKNIIK